MNLQELYSLSTGQKITKPYITEKFYALPFSNYITFQPYSKPIKNYDYYLEVLNLIYPILEKHGIKIIQVGGPNEQPFQFCYHTQGTTNWGQLAYLIKNSKLHFGSDSISQHFAGHYNISLISLISNNYKTSIQPYFGDKNKQIILEPARPEGHKPLFALDGEVPKSINTICPIKIAKSILKLLNLESELNYPYKTLFIGQEYKNRIVESANDCLIDINKLGLQSLLMRNDYNYNLDNLFKQAQVGKISIITDKEIPIEPLKQLKPNIIEIIYKIQIENNPQFVKDLQSIKIPCKLFSHLSEKELNPIKLAYLDAPTPIFYKEIKVPEILKNKDYNNIFYKSSKLTLGRGKIYQSFFDYKSDRAIPSFEPVLSQLLDINLEEVFVDSDYIYLLEKS